MKAPGIAVYVNISCALACSLQAHPGKTDASGGHYDRKTGSYHQHHQVGPTTVTVVTPPHVSTLSPQSPFPHRQIPRTWTFAQDGKITMLSGGAISFKEGGRVDAYFVGADGTNVVLKLVDGNSGLVAMPSLSRRDIGFIMETTGQSAVEAEQMRVAQATDSPGAIAPKTPALPKESRTSGVKSGIQRSLQMRQDLFLKYGEPVSGGVARQFSPGEQLSFKSDSLSITAELDGDACHYLKYKLPHKWTKEQISAALRKNGTGWVIRPELANLFLASIAPSSYSSKEGHRASYSPNFHWLEIWSCELLSLKEQKEKEKQRRETKVPEF